MVVGSTSSLKLCLKQNYSFLGAPWLIKNAEYLIIFELEPVVNPISNSAAFISFHLRIPLLWFKDLR